MSVDIRIYNIWKTVLISLKQYTVITFVFSNIPEKELVERKRFCMDEKQSFF